jgi:formylglycine-generating enzyme required for sulfatase activity
LTDDQPIQNLTWFEAVMFCNWLSHQEGFAPAYQLSGKESIFTYNDYTQSEIEVDRWILDNSKDGYRLPTQAEWEYACRANTKTEWFSGNNDVLLSGYSQIFPAKQTAECGSKMPNPWGLHDFHGNVWEWCQDTRGNNSSRALRGGCSHKRSVDCTYSTYAFGNPSERNPCTGFRLVRTSKP